MKHNTISKHGSNWLISMLICMATIFWTSSACNETPAEPEDTFDYVLTLPASIDAMTGKPVSLKVASGHAPLTSDYIIFQSDEGISALTNFTAASGNEVSFNLPKSIITGNYTVSLKRDDRKRNVGKTFITVGEPVDFEPKASTTAWGKISCGSNGVKGVVVSDGVLVTTTDDKGFWELPSHKERGYVFMSVPSGYEAESNGVLPVISFTFKSDAKTRERADFKLLKASGQDNHIMIALGDMHLANRTGDLGQFRVFTDDLMKYVAANKGTRTYGITLGDMTWDLYWYDRKFSFDEYLKEVNNDITGLQIYHTMGNHDNDFKALNDFDAENLYTHKIAPNYYSYNIGKIHYVVLDDIDCSKYDGTTSRNYFKSISSDQLNWLVEDLEYVDKATPVVITLHAQIYYPSGVSGFTIDAASTRNSNTAQLFDILKGRTVHFITGHTHVCFNVLPTESVTGSNDFYEHNSGSVCGTWWWTGQYHSGMYIGTDGSPAGYQIFNVKGTEISWVFKPTGKSTDHQFRTYDRNTMELSRNMWCPTAGSSSKFEARNNTWESPSSSNYVYFNIWNYNPGWKISVTENGKELTWTRVSDYDPLHMICYTADAPDGNFPTTVNNHMFRVQASSATSTLEFRITDNFGNVYTESMARPKAFNLNTYK